MKEIVFDFFNYFVFFYTSLLAISFIVMMFLSFASLKLSKSYYDDNYVRRVLSESPYTPGVSVIAPAYNEEKTIIDNVDSMLGLDYPIFEVVIVNDGSKDSTLDKLIEHYELVEVPFAYIERIKTQPFRRVLKSTNPEYHRLIVVDKENGGTKADASNAGINAAQYPYFICTDVDCILRRDALYRCIWPLLSSSKHVIAVSGTMRMANGCRIKDGQVVEVRPPHTPIPLFQNLEYMRSYLVGKMGWSAINAMPNVSGGFGLFDRQIAIAAGGYDPMSFAEDMDLLARMVGYMCDFSRPYKVVQVPETCCWTEGPPNLVVLYRQRTRWGRGLFQALMIHRKMIFNKTYRQTGLLTLPYMVIFEFLAPIIEFTGLVVFLFLAHDVGDLSGHLPLLPVPLAGGRRLRLLFGHALPAGVRIYLDHPRLHPRTVHLPPDNHLLFPERLSEPPDVPRVQVGQDDPQGVQPAGRRRGGRGSPGTPPGGQGPQ